MRIVYISVLIDFGENMKKAIKSLLKTSSLGLSVLCLVSYSNGHAQQNNYLLPRSDFDMKTQTILSQPSFQSSHQALPNGLFDDLGTQYSYQRSLLDNQFQQRILKREETTATMASLNYTAQRNETLTLQQNQLSQQLAKQQLQEKELGEELLAITKDVDTLNTYLDENKDKKDSDEVQACLNEYKDRIGNVQEEITKLNTIMTQTNSQIMMNEMQIYDNAQFSNAFQINGAGKPIFEMPTLQTSFSSDMCANQYGNGWVSCIDQNITNKTNQMNTFYSQQFSKPYQRNNLNRYNNFNPSYYMDEMYPAPYQQQRQLDPGNDQFIVNAEEIYV